ncbi:hypothetical protein UFOVP965_139 [uncultured Caudovirales phage]|uniref:Uncharacterized protein n=1 Tax=uncultured Caudovirales phage TaxID=2100421 RepID=A0A6J5QFC9_9CAUD|nr:hypothetical protein UFOVP965_139 [uncultured Caudovirales phage]CAB4179928.1 hypothetical protein UFOVP1035_135 [uncultured Caudovirales phage]CAB4188779.1 hypothetical protein UFOVP1181_94 [uncultured Caudovirales phage]
MRFKKKAPWVKPFSEKIAKRVSRIPTGELETWTEQSIYEVGRLMSLYSRGRDSAYLTEALNGAEAMHAVINELHTRMTRP